MSLLLFTARFSLRYNVFNACRLYSTEPSSSSKEPVAAEPPTPKVSVADIAKLRKLVDVSLSRAREALSASNNSIEGAAQYLSTHADDKKASKVAGRTTNEGLIGVSAISRGATGRMRASVWGGMIEMNCETDFVARNELFARLLAEVAHTAAYYAPEANERKGQTAVDGALINPFSVEQLMDAPLMSYTNTVSVGEPLPTVGQAIRTLMGQVGENISIRRAAVVKHALLSRKDVGLRLAMYGHGGTHTQPNGWSGRVAAMAIMALKTPAKDGNISEWFRQRPTFGDELRRLEDAVARQVVGFPTTSISASDSAGTTDGEEVGALYRQAFTMMYPESQGANVKAVLDKWAQKHELAGEESEAGAEVVEFLKWTVGGESVEAKK